MRYTVVDAGGSVSFVGPCHALKMLVAACAQMPTTLAEVLAHLRRLDRQFADEVGDALAVFDEHHVGGAADPRASITPVAAGGIAERPVFRVLDAASREASLRPVGAGLVLFNLIERRIVQVHNTYAAVERQARGRLRRNGRPVQTFYSYDLPEEWRVVP
jgi:hypothetical protein